MNQHDWGYIHDGLGSLYPEMTCQFYANLDAANKINCYFKTMVGGIPIEVNRELIAYLLNLSLDRSLAVPQTENVRPTQGQLYELILNRSES